MMASLLFLLHRYLGLAVGCFMLLWCLSGFVMMYVQYPEMDREAKLSGLLPLNLTECCALPQNIGLRQATFDAARIEMLDGNTPVLRMHTSGLSAVTIDLRRGSELRHVDPSTATGIARDFAHNRRMELMNEPVRVVDRDQWTVTGAYNPHRPLYLFRAADSARTEWYVSSATGEVVLVTTASERFWNYFGAVAHWLYPAILRQHPILWAQAVIWLSVAGVLLTLTGLYAGLRQFRRSGAGRPSPYKGVALWHYYTGLVAGVLALLWVGSGLLSMNPWGLLEGEGSSMEASALQGGALGWTEIVDLVNRIDEVPVSESTVQLEMFRSGGRPMLTVAVADSSRTRFDASSLLAAPLTASELKRLTTSMLPGEEVAESAELDAGDAYYYSRHTALEFPVYRIVAADEERTRYYLSATTGQLILKIDDEAKWYRWLFSGVHSMDFTLPLRQHTFWDILLKFMLAGVTVLCATGTYLGIRSLRK